MPKPTSGALVGGKYQILRAIGEGGMGTVYEAEHQLTHKRAAIKWLHPQSGPSAHERLLHEARATARIRHRNVVDVYDVLQDGEAVCLVMQFLVGEPLSERIARGPMPLWEFVALLLPAMQGVLAAHEVGVVHRDIKPDNIFLAHESGHAEVVPKIIDFGISKIFEPQASWGHTHSGVTMGTPRYVSYEQLLGARNVDVRTDVYAFGVMLYEAITGHSPYRATTFGEQAVAFAVSVPARVSTLRPETPRALDELVSRAIAKDRDARFSSMQELISALIPFARKEALPVSFRAFEAQRSPSEVPLLHAVTQPEGSAGVARDDHGALDESRLDENRPLSLPLWSPARRVLQHSHWFGVSSLAGLCVLIALAWSQLRPFHESAIKHRAVDAPAAASAASREGPTGEEQPTAESQVEVAMKPELASATLPLATQAPMEAVAAQPHAPYPRSHLGPDASKRMRRVRSLQREPNADTHEQNLAAHTESAVLGEAAPSGHAVVPVLYTAGSLAREEF